MHPVSQRLPIHPTDPRPILAAHPVVHCRQRQQPPRLVGKRPSVVTPPPRNPPEDQSAHPYRLPNQCRRDLTNHTKACRNMPRRVILSEGWYYSGSRLFAATSVRLINE